MSAPKECAIVGGGLAGLVGYATLRHRGLTPAEIAVFGTDPDPAGQWRVRAAAIRQRRMRSESDGHCAPRSFPGLAVRAALRRKSPVPLVESWLDRYRPTVGEFLEHVEEVRAETGWDESFRRRRVARISAVDDGFELEGLGRFRHVLVATGHPGLAVPPEADAFAGAAIRLLRDEPARRAMGSAPYRCACIWSTPQPGRRAGRITKSAAAIDV